MKIKITMKNPDSVYDALREAGIPRDELNGNTERVHPAWETINKFVEFDEYVTIELDTATGTAFVHNTEE